MRPEILRAIIFACIVSFPCSGYALVGDTDGPFGLDGSLRTIFALTDLTRLPPFFRGDRSSDRSLRNLLRLTADGRPTEDLAYEIHLVQNLEYVSNEFSGIAFSPPATARFQALDASWEQMEKPNGNSRLWLDRFNIRLSLDIADITLGRQAITFGKAYFWNPLDVFFPFEPQQIDRDYKAGVDALRIDIPFDDFSGFNLIGVIGRKVFPENREDRLWDSTSYGSALLMRTYTTMMDWDFALQSGKIYGGYQFGCGAVGEVGPLESRLEATYFYAEDSDPLPFPLRGDIFEDHITLVAGTGRTFENSFVFSLEYLYNGAGESGAGIPDSGGPEAGIPDSGDLNNLDVSFTRVGLGSSLHMSEHLLGLQLKYDIMPIFTSQLVWIYSITDQSSLIQPTFFLSLADEVDLLFGANFSFGDRPDLGNGMIPRLKSEFGTYPDLYFAELKYYF